LKPRQIPVLGDKKKRNQGFTFAELLAAMVFMAIAIPVILEGIALANKSAVFSERKIEAARLAENIINEMVLLDSWKLGTPQGQIERNRILYRWQMVLNPWQNTEFQLLTVIVYFPVQGQEYSVELSTLVINTEMMTDFTKAQ